jgi:hypothetical protein
MVFLTTFVLTFFLCWVTMPALLAALKAVNFYTTIPEGHCKVYLLFGRVVGVIHEPGLHLPWLRLGPQASLVRLFGRVQDIDMRLDQEYLRSNPVNSEEAPPWESAPGTR